MSNLISQLQISTTLEQEEKFKSQGFTQVQGDLYRSEHAHPAFLWYKQDDTHKPITRFHISGRKEIVKVLSDAGFIKIDVNTGTDDLPLFLWYLRGNTEFDIPIVGIKVTTSVEEEPALALSGWERLGSDLYWKPAEKMVHVWVKRSEPAVISAVMPTVIFSEDADLFERGFSRIDKGFNRNKNPSGPPVFLWYQLSKANSAKLGISHIEVSRNKSEEDDLQAKGFVKIDKNLSPDRPGEPFYIWYKCDQPALKFLTLLVGENARQAYENQQIKVVEKNLNQFRQKERPIYIAYL